MVVMVVRKKEFHRKGLGVVFENFTTIYKSKVPGVGSDDLVLETSP